MTKKVEIEIEIDKTGKVQFHVKGRKGPSCMEFLELMKNNLGTLENYKLTDEYYAAEETSEAARINTITDE